MMLEQNAEVVRSEPGLAWVRAQASDGCGSCGNGGCGSRQLAEFFSVRPRVFRVRDPLGTSPGDLVLVGVPEGSIWRGALSAYGLPLLLLFLGAALGQWLGENFVAHSMSVAGTLVFGLGGFFWLRARTHDAPGLAVILKRQGIVTRSAHA